ncbi:MAG TPA: hypothetical protein PKZ76_01775 [Xanthomonadaceae bacterium]|nr:hypothetical protein [Xanthomonadaceae bacterium]
MSIPKCVLLPAGVLLAFSGAASAWTPVELDELTANAESEVAVRAPHLRGEGFTCPGGAPPTVLYATDFELGSAGWAVGGAGDWERGQVVPEVYSLCDTVPSPEPASAFSGVNVFATNLDGCYANQNPSAASTLEQTFDFSSVSQPIALEWMHWYHIFETFDRGEVFVNGVQVFRTPDANPTPDYVVQVADLSAFAFAPSVTIQFSLFSTTVVNRMGWYLDDIRILTCGPAIFADGFEDP